MYFNIENRGDGFFIRDETGNHKHYGFMPEVFFPAHSNTGIVSLEKSTDLQPKVYDNCRDFRDTLKDYRGRSDSAIYGTKNLITQFMIQNYKGVIEFDVDKIQVFNLDIEVDATEGFPLPQEAKFPVNAITVEYGTRIFTWGLPPNGEEYIAPEGEDYKAFETEVELLGHFLKFWKNNCPHVVTGWNTEGFDMPYLFHRIKRLIGKEMATQLSPWGIVDEREKRGQYDKTFHIVKIWGVSNLDYLKLYKKFELEPRENYKLDTIAHVELGEKKLDYSEVGSLMKLYREDYAKFIRYNVQDVRLVSRIDAKKKLLELAYTIAYYAKVNYESVFSPIATWESVIYGYLYDKKQLPRIKFTKATKGEKYMGAYVMEPKPAMYKWVVAFDLASLYPRTISQYNLGIETMINAYELPEELHDNYANINSERLVSKEYDLSILKENDMCMSANGFYYSNSTKSFLSQLMEDLFARRREEQALKKQADLQLTELLQQENPDPKEVERLENAKSKHHMFQYSFKILLNSCYGMLGSPNSDWFDIRLAESITASGQLALKWIMRILDEKLTKFNDGEKVVVYGDTDSVYMSLENIVEKECQGMTKQEKVDWVDGFCKNVIQKIIDKGYEELYEYMNCPQNTMDMEREIIADRAIWSAKKRYVCNVYDKEGKRYEVPKPKIMGLDIIKSTIPEYTKGVLKEVVVDILNGADEDEVLKQKSDNLKLFKKRNLNDIAINKTVNFIEKYLEADGVSYKSGTPMHSKASIVFNNYIDKTNSELDPITEGSKVKLLQLLEPNPAGSPVIAYDSILPEELSKYVNYKLMFEKTFEAPLKSVTNPVGWTLQEKHDLEGFI